jgi:nucleoside recognition membrane protein YjiH
MVSLTSLWLPILLSAVIVFVASSILHMLLPIHKSDYSKVPEEEKLLDAIRSSGVTPGHIYHFPFCTHKDMKSAETAERFKRGPVGLLTVIPSGPPAMGKYFGQWFAYCVLIGIFVAYLTGRTRTPGAPYLEVFRVAGTVAFLGYAAALIQSAIWKGEPWRITGKHIVDGLIYALLTAGIFGWLWPK